MATHEGVVYFIQAVESGRIKIGYSSNSGKRRLAEMSTGSPEQLEVLGEVPGDVAFERELHRRLRHSRLHGEWFELTPEVLEVLAEYEISVPDRAYARWAMRARNQTGMIEAREEELGYLRKEVSRLSYEVRRLHNKYGRFFVIAENVVDAYNMLTGTRGETNFHSKSNSTFQSAWSFSFALRALGRLAWGYSRLNGEVEATNLKESVRDALRRIHQEEPGGHLDYRSESKESSLRWLETLTQEDKDNIDEQIAA